MNAWREGRAPHVSHPFYERDNVPANLLARVYVAACEGRLGAYVGPSFYTGPVGQFFQRERLNNTLQLATNPPFASAKTVSPLAATTLVGSTVSG